MEVLASEGPFEIMLEVAFRDVLDGSDRCIDQYITQNDELFDSESVQIAWQLLQRRLAMVDLRLSELGVELSVPGISESSAN